MKTINIYLVPGFFGFSKIASFSYFRGVSEILEKYLSKKNVEVKIFETSTQPTGSITRRARRLIDEIINTGGLDVDELHFVGHSTGGLDVRLLVSPGVRLVEGDVEEEIGLKTKSVITISTPHFGTPLTNYFATLQGRYILQIITILATSDVGRRFIFLESKLLAILAKMDDWMGRTDTFLDKLSEKLLKNFTHNKDDLIYKYLEDISSDQGCIIQLTPEGMHLYNAAVDDRFTCNYQSIITAAPPPPFNYGIGDVFGVNKALMTSMFTFLHKLAGREHPHYPYPYLEKNNYDAIQNELPFKLDSSTNDGIVPTMSQVYGNLAKVVVGDHLDVVGQYPGDKDDPLRDWLPSASRFNEEKFNEVWQCVADIILDKK
jgi:triacylglycerol lipase